MLALVAAVAVLLVPLVVFTGIDRGWFGNDAGAEPVHHDGASSRSAKGWPAL
jgi:hypothetical protein